MVNRVGIGRRGFSLLEVLLASLIFAVVFGAMAAAWIFHEKSLKKYRNRNAARNIATQEMERVTGHNFMNLSEAARDETVSLYREIDGVTTQQDFRVISNVSTNSRNTLKDVFVKVEFAEENAVRELKLQTRVFLTQ